MTPEGKIKNMIKDVLDAYGCYYFMPVQTGLGASGLDFHCVIHGRAFFIEAKRDELVEPTNRQHFLINTLRSKHNCEVFVVGGIQSLKQLSTWLEARFRENAR